MNIAFELLGIGMGIVGGPHCIAMCSAPCAIAVRARPGMQGVQDQALFHFGRSLGYALIGSIAATTLSGIALLGNTWPVFRPLWSVFQVAMLVTGLWMMILASQPMWFDDFGQSVWKRLQQLVRKNRSNAHWHANSSASASALQTTSVVLLPRAGLSQADWTDLSQRSVVSRISPLAKGALWALMPCGLLYSALMMAALAGDALSGATFMFGFALGTTMPVAFGANLWAALARRGLQSMGFRMAGAMLVLVASLALMSIWTGDPLPWCAPK